MFTNNGAIRTAGGKAPEPEGTTYGYARVSTAGQKLDRQIDALLEFGIPESNMFTDTASGKNFNRERYMQMKETIGRGDTLVIMSIDRLGRNYDEMLVEWHDITETRGADIVVLDMPLLNTRAAVEGLTGKFISGLVLQVLCYVAQVERENTLARQAQGIEAARLRGVRFGRPRIKRPKSWDAVANDFREGRIDRAAAAKQLGVSISTFDRWRTAERNRCESLEAE